MITDLENLLNEDQFRELVKAINANKDFKLAKDGLTIESKSNDNSFQIQISYDGEEDLANQEADEFKKIINNIDDEIFIMTCEFLGSENLNKIQKCLDSKKLETVRSGITCFKQAVKQSIENKIKYFKSCLNSFSK